MDFNEIKKGTWKVYGFVNQKKVQLVLAFLLFLVIIFVGANIRVQNLPNLIDPTTGDYTPLALDPYYFLRMSETLIANDGELPEIDVMRYPAQGVGWTSDLTPYATVWIYRIMTMFDSSVTLNYANVLNPVIFFVVGLVGFFFLALLLIGNRWAALIASTILVVIPPYLYRTLAGFSDHESIGMAGFFFSLLFFSLGMIWLEKEKSKKYIGLAAFLSGIATMFAVASWGGGGKFLFMILPLAFFATWFIKKDKKNYDYILFYFLWLLGVLVSAVPFRESLMGTIGANMLNPTGMLTFVALGYIIIETILLKYGRKFGEKVLKYRVFVSFGILAVVGILLYEIFIGSSFNLLMNILDKVVNPFGTERISLTVAENKQPYLSDWIGQITRFVFYTFLLGNFIICLKIASGIRKRKARFLFIGGFLFFIIGILYSRISPSSFFNGANFWSQALVFISFIAFAASVIYAYIKSEWKIDTKWIIMAAWMIPMLLAVRSAIRVFFAIVPFVSLMIPIALFEIGAYAKKSKDNLVKLVLVSAAIILVLGLINTTFSFYQSVNYQAKNQRPSYNLDWQNGMSWVRNNTLEGSIFLHWWDYGYWVQTGGDRPSVTDGGHGNHHWDHLIGRYVLTTPHPETAKSFMKAHNASYLLIDSTDIGKYPAYSSIGNDKDSSDRVSWMPVFNSDRKEIQETGNGTVRLYRGGFTLDEDVHHGDVFLPGGVAGLGAIVIEKSVLEEGDGGGDVVFGQPIGIFVHNNQQYRLPLRYAYIQGNLMDFGGGVDATAYIFANVYNSQAGQQFDMEGAIIYLSKRTQNSLVARLYLMDDPLNEYEELDLVHSQGTYPFPFYYGGFRGPIKIWKINTDEMDDIIAREEFTARTVEYGEFDDLQFIK